MSSKLNQPKKTTTKLTKTVSFNNKLSEVRNNVVISEGLSEKKRQEYYKVERAKRQGDWVPNQFANNVVKNIEGDLHNAPFEKFPSGVLRKMQPFNYKSSSKKLTPSRLDKLKNEASYNVNSMVSSYKQSENNQNKIAKYKETIETKKRKATRVLDVISRKIDN
jgi:hypothetical protein